MKRFNGVLVVAIVASFTITVHAQTYELVEPITPARIFNNQVTVSVAGTMQTPAGDKTATELKMNMKAGLEYRSRRLPSAGRDARSFRSLRLYDQANANISVADEKSKSMLPANLKTVVAEGQSSGIMFYSPVVVISRNNADLLAAPADPLAVVAMLPKKAVAVGDSWSPDSWTVSMLTSVEAVLDSKMTCTLKSVTNDNALVEFKGEVQGAIAGAETKILLSGQFTYDLKEKLISQIKVEQTEKRSVGTVSPGMDVLANVTVDRKLSQVSVGLTDKDAEKISLDPGEKAELLSFQPAKWDMRFFHGRNWHIFQEVPEVVVIRLIENGGLISQCNAARIQRSAVGTHTSEERFQADIRKSLGGNLQSLVSADEVKLNQNIYIYRVIANGQVGKQKVQWRYYLCAAPDGRQVSFVFAVDPGKLDVLKDRDLAIVSSLQFLAEK